MRILRTVLVIFICCMPMATLAVQQYTVRVTDQKPQSREIFVQGLEIVDGYLYVSSGRYGHSHLLRYHFAQSTLDTARKLDAKIFAEGLTVFEDTVYQLTWHNRGALVYHKQGLQFDHVFSLPGEGWGLTNNAKELIYSDGSDQLHFLSPQTKQILHSIQVTENGKPLPRLNELEWVDGKIWANVWQTDRIVIIEPTSGEVTASIDLQGLLPANERRAGTDVLNGIARNPADGSIWVTGKRWPWLYQIALDPVTPVSK